MSGVHIWFNRNFATNMHTLEQIRNNADGREVTLFGSHVDVSSPMLTACDQAFLEPPLVGDEYADYALHFCQENAIDVFLPVLNQEAIAHRLADFEAAGVKVIAPPAGAIALLGDKANTYRALAGHPELIPPWREVHSSVEFADAVDYFADEFGPSTRLVLKPSRGVGADGVRFLVPGQPTLAGLLGPVEPIVTPEEVRRVMQSAESVGTHIPGVLVMPYLQRPEISVDVLARDGEVVVGIPRVKEGRDRVLNCDPAVLPIAHELVKLFGLHALVNVQFRYWRDQPVLLEINTRPAGGLFQTSLTGVNVPWLAVKMALGEEITAAESTPTLGARYVTVTNLVPLDRTPEVQILPYASAAGDLVPDPVHHVADEGSDGPEFTEVGPVVGVNPG